MLIWPPPAAFSVNSGQCAQSAVPTAVRLAVVSVPSVAPLNEPPDGAVAATYPLTCALMLLAPAALVAATL